MAAERGTEIQWRFLPLTAWFFLMSDVETLYDHLEDMFEFVIYSVFWIVLCIMCCIVLWNCIVYCLFWHPSPSGITRITLLNFSILIMEDSEHFFKEQSSIQPLSDLKQNFSFMKAPSHRSTNLPCLAFIPFIPWWVPDLD